MKMIVKSVLIFLTATAMCVMLCACSTNHDDKVVTSQSIVETNFIETHAWRLLYLCSDAKMKELSAIVEQLKVKCDEENIELVLIDCSGKDSVFLNVIDEMDTMNLDAVLVTVSNENLGPLIQDKCNESGLPLISIESRLKNSEGQDIPFVGGNMYKSGCLMGETIAEEARRRGYVDGNEKTIVLMLDMTNVVSASQIMRGFRNEMENRLPELYSENYISLEVISGSMDKQCLSVEKYFNKLDSNTNYIMVAFNDEGAYALATFALDNELDSDRLLIGCVGGFEYSREIFDTMKRINDSYFVVPVDCGELVEEAVNLMLEKLNNGTEISNEQILTERVITLANYKDYFFQDELS